MKLIRESFDRLVDRERRIADYRAKHLSEDVKKLADGKWANVGKDGKADSGKFKTKKEADAQRKAMFANGYKESIKEPLSYEDTKKILKDKISKFPKGALSRANIRDILVADCNYSTKDANDFVSKFGVSGVRTLVGESLEEKTEECLTEDVEIEIETKDEPKVEVEDSDEHSIKNVPEMPSTDCKMIIANILNPLIKDELEAIDGYNGAVSTIRGILENPGHDTSIDYDGIMAVLAEITNEENLHIGQLEKLLEMVSPNAESINDGKEEAEEQLAEVGEPEQESNSSEEA